MRLLVDSCISKFAVSFLREKGYSVVWIPEEGKDPGDEQILHKALQEKRVLVTADKDFGDLVFVFQKPHSAIIRLVNFKPKEQSRVIDKVLRSYEDELHRKPIITVNKSRLRVKYPAG